MWAITHRCQLAFKKKKKKKNQVRSPSPESRVPETGSDPPIGSGRDSGRDTYHPQTSGQVKLVNREIKTILMKVVNSNRKD